MDVKAEGSSDLGRDREPPTLAFAELARMRALLRGRAQQDTVDGPRVRALLEGAEVLQAVYTWAAEMQLGAEGFDNTSSAQRYGQVQEHLRAAAREILKACAVLESP